MRKNDEYLLKICIMGKNSAINSQFGRLIATRFHDVDYSPILGVDIPTTTIIVDGNPVKLIIVITAGQEFFGKLRPSYYRGASGGIILFDKGEKKALAGVGEILTEFKNHISAAVPISLVGIKKDKNLISKEEGKTIAQDLDLYYFETYPESKIRVYKIFKFMARKIIE
ncbi:MAG: hypothetical protein ACXACP_06385 [Candidatus Hodarchaeales archaeon]|jgi:GTPase SAR1 family protein